MSDIAIKFENISKQYRLGIVGTGTISHDLNRWWHTVRGKEDPYLKVGEINDRSSRATSKYVWALKDITFDVKQGEVLGIIGKNGAGKSTLLKILSRVTAPTTGSIKAKGRIASLLEVGTGFHPELTGRENIYMNGSIMGMTRAEITRKLDEIVDFAGIEKYIDTPAKRYSSGMTVRLGFAIAAHLEPEILVVDEVLAVGDAEFQKKAIGKMKDVSTGEGRTVLFVSHNMPVVKSLCKNGVILKNGTIDFMGNIDDCVDRYITYNESLEEDIIDSLECSNPDVNITSFTINGSPANEVYLASNENILNIRIEGSLKSKKKIALEVRFYDSLGKIIFLYSPSHLTGELSSYESGNFTIEETVHLPEGLNRMNLFMKIELTHPNYESYLRIKSPVKLSIEGIRTANGLTMDVNSGFIFLK